MTSSEQKFEVILSTCDETSAAIAGRKYGPGTRGEKITPKTEFLKNDILSIEIPDLNLAAKIGDASKISAISVRICEEGRKISVIPFYTDMALNTSGCCVCCTNGNTTTCVYGSSGCSC